MGLLDDTDTVTYANNSVINLVRITIGVLLYISIFIWYGITIVGDNYRIVLCLHHAPLALQQVFQVWAHRQFKRLGASADKRIKLVMY